MGWWSHTIMGGDPPLDAVFVLGDALGLSSDYEEEEYNYEDLFYGYPFHTKLLENKKNCKKIVEVIREIKQDKEDRRVTGQVAGVLYLWAGAAMTPELRDLIIECIRGELNDACYFVNPPKRKAYLEDLLGKVVQNWEGSEESITVSEEGLFESIAKIRSAGTI